MTITKGRHASVQAARAANDHSYTAASILRRSAAFGCKAGRFPSPASASLIDAATARSGSAAAPSNAAGWVQSGSGAAPLNAGRSASPSSPSPSGVAAAHAVSTSHERPVHRLDADCLEPEFERLIDKTVAAASAASGDLADLTFGELGAIASFIHSARCHDGLMLQTGLALIASQHPDLAVLTRDVELPVTEAAQALIARNRPGELSGIRLGSEVFAREHYKADMIIVDETRRFAVVCDVKRSTASYNAAKLGRLKAKLLACAVVAPDHLRTRHQIEGVRTCHAAILDLSGHADLADPDVFGLDALDAFLAIDGAGRALRDLKRRFGDAVQAELARRLRSAFPAMTSPARHGQRPGGRAGIGHVDAAAIRSSDAFDHDEDAVGGIDAEAQCDQPDAFDGDGDLAEFDAGRSEDDADPRRSHRRPALTQMVSIALARPGGVAGSAPPPD